MAKKKLIKNITIDKLAKIINDGFNEQTGYMEKRFNEMDKKFDQVATKKELDEVKKDVKYIKENIDDASKLTGRVDYIENILAIKKN